MRFFETLIGSFHSADTYRQVRKSANFFMGYTLLLVTLCTLVVTVYFSITLHRFAFTAQNGQDPAFDRAIQQIADQWPVMTYSDNKLATKEPVATVIRISTDKPGEDFALITIDTTGASDHSTMQTPVLITANEIIIKNDRKTEIHPLSDFGQTGTIVINRALIDETANSFIRGVHQSLSMIYLILGGFAWFALIIVFYIMRLCMLLVLGLGGLIISSVMRSPVTFPQAFSLAAVSYTPIAIIDTLAFTFFAYTLQTATLVFAGLAALAIAIICSREPVAVIP